MVRKYTRRISKKNFKKKSRKFRKRSKVNRRSRNRKMKGGDGIGRQKMIQKKLDDADREVVNANAKVAEAERAVAAKEAAVAAAEQEHQRFVTTSSTELNEDFSLTDNSSHWILNEAKKNLSAANKALTSAVADVEKATLKRDAISSASLP